MVANTHRGWIGPLTTQQAIYRQRHRKHERHSPMTELNDHVAAVGATSLEVPGAPIRTSMDAATIVIARCS